MTPNHEQLRTWDRELVWHAFTQMSDYDPLIIESARGCILTDIDGRNYIDGVSSLWCNVHGHRHPQLDAAIHQQLSRVAHVTSLGLSNPTTIEFAKRLVDITPVGLDHIFFSDDGATSVEVALKMAFQYWRQCDAPCPQKTKYLAYADGYHGDTLGSTSVGGVARFHEIFRSLLFEVIRLPCPDVYRHPGNETLETICDYHLNVLEETLQKHHQEIAAIVIEPLVQGAAGIIVHPPGYLAGVRRLSRQYDVLMIADEVAVGYGRTGKMFACEHEDVSPDFLCLAKGITGGYLPLAATLTNTEVWNAFLGEYAESKTFFHGHTYGGNPLGAAVALANLDVFEQEQTLAKLPAKIERLRQNLCRISEHRFVGDVRQRGMMVGVELVRNRQTKEPFHWADRRGARVCEHALQHGVWLRPLGNVVVIMPPLSIEMEQLDQIGDAVLHGIDWAMKEV